MHNLTENEIWGLLETIEAGCDERREYLRNGNPHIDYGDDWPDAARQQAASLRRCASALRKLGDGEALANATTNCERVAGGLEASAAEYRNPEVDTQL